MLIKSKFCYFLMDKMMKTFFIIQIELLIKLVHLCIFNKTVISNEFTRISRKRITK